MTAQQENTLGYYNQHAPAVAAQYDKVDFSGVLNDVRAFLPARARVLEIGSGSGRDAATLLADGYRVTGIDGSQAMLSEALHLHPELNGMLRHHVLPEPLPFAADEFDAVLAFAVIMHLDELSIEICLRDIARVIRHGGLFFVSVNTRRDGLNAAGSDSSGRAFTVLPSADWQRLLTRVGLITIRLKQSTDIVGRTGIEWVTLIATKEET